MLAQRIKTAVILVIVFAAMLFLTTPSQFQWCMGAVVLFAAWEWYRLATGSDNLQSPLFIGFIAALLFGIAGLSFGFDAFVLSAIIAWVLALALIYHYPESQKLLSSSILNLALGWLIIVLTFHGCVYLFEQSVWLLLAAFASIWVADIGAYFFGKAFGKNKLAPQVSPGKSWEGYFGGLLSVIILMLVLQQSGFIELTVIKTLILALFVHAMSVIGDLFESLFKRYRGVKDSSQLLPGHGGVLDRIDSVLAAIPTFWILYGWVL